MKIDEMIDKYLERIDEKMSTTFQKRAKKAREDLKIEMAKGKDKDPKRVKMLKDRIGSNDSLYHEALETELNNKLGKR